MVKNVKIKDPAIKTTMMAAALLMVLLLNSTVLFANEYKFFQGVVVSLEEKGHLIVNENKRIRILKTTLVRNKKDKIIPLKSIKAGKWVYVEGPLNMNGSIDAEIIYLLPGRISKKERHKYPFMRLPF